MKKDGTKVVTLRLPERLYSALYQLAASHHHSMNAEVQNLIEEAARRKPAADSPLP